MRRRHHRRAREEDGSAEEGWHIHFARNRMSEVLLRVIPNIIMRPRGKKRQMGIVCFVFRVQAVPTQLLTPLAIDSNVYER